MSPHARRQSRRRHLALAIVLSLVIVPFVGASPVQAADCPGGIPQCVVVKVVATADGETEVLEQYVVAPADIEAWSDFPAARQYYKRRNLDGKVSKGPNVQAQKGISLHTLLKQLNPELTDGVTFSESRNAGGIPAVLADTDLSDPQGDYDKDDPYPFDETLPPAIYIGNDGLLGYVRPLRDQKTDVNISDIFTVPGRLDLTIHTTGRLLEPVVGASGGTDVSTKDKNTFSYTFATRPGTRIDTTRWDFGDGTTKGLGREKPTHTYAKRGTYSVAVAVRGADGSYGRSAALVLKVGKPPKPPASGGGGGSGSGFGGGGGFGGGFINPDPFGGITDDPPADAPEDDLGDAPVDDGLEQVEGFVLAGAEIAPGGTLETIPGTEGSAQPAPATQDSLRTRMATWAVAALAVMLLIGIGAAGETRWFTTQWQHLRRRT